MCPCGVLCVCVCVCVCVSCPVELQCVAECVFPGVGVFILPFREADYIWIFFKMDAGVTAAFGVKTRKKESGASVGAPRLGVWGAPPSNQKTLTSAACWRQKAALLL